LDRGALARALPLPRRPRRRIRPARHVLLDGRALVSGVGIRRAVLRSPAELRAFQSSRLRAGVAHADARDPRWPRLPRAPGAGPRHIHGAAAPRHRESLPLLSGREPLGAEAGRLDRMVRRRSRMAAGAFERVNTPKRRQTAQVLIVTGLPAAGKTTLAMLLARRWSVPFLGKDLIKEPLLDVLGATDASAARRLSDASFAILFALARELVAAGASLVLEGNFRPAEHAPAARALSRTAKCAQVLCLS